MTHSDDYLAIYAGAALGAVASRSQIAVAGEDRRAYLQGLLTNDIQSLTAGTGCYAAWLSPQGRMLTDMHVLESGDMVLLDVPAEQAESTLQRLDQYVFTEDVRLEALTESIGDVWIHGPRAAAVLGTVVPQANGIADWTEYRHARAAWQDEPIVVGRIDQLGVPGYCVYLPRARAADFARALQSGGALVAGREAIEAARIEAGYPVFGVDMTDDTIPLEAGIEQRAISFTKGCYVGQEIIIRVLHRGGGRVARKLVGLRIDGARPDPGTRLLSGERAIGAITSAAVSPRSGTIAMGYVHRDFVEPGTAIAVEAPGGRLPASVTARPMSRVA